MPIEQFNFFYNQRKILLNILTTSCDYGKLECYFYIRDIDEILNLNWSTKKKSIVINSSYDFKSLKAAICNDYYEGYALEKIDSAFRRLDGLPSIKNRNRFQRTPQKPKPLQYSIVKYNENDEEDDDEVLVDEIGVLEYFYKCANTRKHPDFEVSWREFLRQVRCPTNLIKIFLNRMCIDFTSHVEIKKKICLNNPIEFVMFAGTENMIKDDKFLITTTCDTKLTIEYLNEISLERYYSTYLVPVINSNKVYVELLELLKKNCEPPYGRIKENSKIFYLSSQVLELSYIFLESKRSNLEFV